jgi:hypothetical protein
MVFVSLVPILSPTFLPLFNTWFLLLLQVVHDGAVVLFYVILDFLNTVTDMGYLLRPLIEEERNRDVV